MAMAPPGVPGNPAGNGVQVEGTGACPSNLFTLVTRPIYRNQYRRYNDHQPLARKWHQPPPINRDMARLVPRATSRSTTRSVTSPLRRRRSSRARYRCESPATRKKRRAGGRPYRGGSCLPAIVMGPAGGRQPAWQCGARSLEIGNAGARTKWLFNYIYDGASIIPDTVMPPWGSHGFFHDQEINDMVLS